MESISWYVGIDQHKDFSEVAVLDARGQLREAFEVIHDDLPLRGFEAWLAQRRGRVAVALEATGFYWWLVDFLWAQEAEVHLAHPAGVAVIGKSASKTDRKDAAWLARLLRLGELPEAYIPTVVERECRDLLGTYSLLVRQRTQLCNRIRMLLGQFRIPFSWKTLHVPRALEALRGLTLPGEHQYTLQTLVDALEAQAPVIRELKAHLEEFAALTPALAQMVALSQVGPITALALVGFIGDWKRFGSRAQIASYAGLAPSVRSTSHSTRVGSIHHRGPGALRWVLAEFAWRLVVKNALVQTCFMALARRQGKKRAIVAIARRLIVGLWAAEVKGVPFSLERCFPWRASRRLVIRRKGQPRA